MQRSFEDVFITSLVAAGTCEQHAPLRMTRCKEQCGLASRAHGDGALGHHQRRDLFTTARSQQTLAVAVVPEQEAELEPEPHFDISQEEYKGLVNTYGSPSEMWERPGYIRPRHYTAPKLSVPATHVPLAPRLVISPEKEDKPPYVPRQILQPEDSIQEGRILKLENLLCQPPGSVSHKTLWNLYKKIQPPRPRYLSDETLRSLLRHLTWAEYKHAPSASERYFALMDECMEEGVPLSIAEWSSAISFAGRSIRRGTTEEVKRAIEMWMRMENTGLQATSVTFTILFDIAVKAGRFALADTIHNELKARDMELNRYFRASMIYYAGLVGDGEAVRRAFNQLVEAGEIVDTAVMNCVILSLIRAGEAPAAEHVFARMKLLHETKFGTKGSNDWREQKELSRLLDQTARRLREERKAHEATFFGGQHSADDRKEEVQKASPIAPNAKTYRTLLHYHIKASGDMERVQELLAEMKGAGFAVHGSVYANLFWGFEKHGGYAFTSWLPSMLEGYWRDFLQASEGCPAKNAGKRLLDDPAGDNLTLEELEASMNEDVDEGYYSSVSSESSDSESEAGDEDDERFLPDEAEQNRSPYFTSMLATGVVRAYYKCLGRNKMLEVWEEIKVRWKDMTKDEREGLQDVVDRRLRD